MKFNGINLVTHPLILALSFMLLIIADANSWGFFIQIVLGNLLPATVYGWLGFIGLLILLFSYSFIRHKAVTLYGVANIVGALLMWASVYTFFLRPGGRSFYDTFFGFLPMVLFALYNLLSLVFIIFNLTRTNSDRSSGHGEEPLNTEGEGL